MGRTTGPFGTSWLVWGGGIGSVLRGVQWSGGGGKGRELGRVPNSEVRYLVVEVKLETWI